MLFEVSTMAKTVAPFMRLDVDFIHDPDIQLMLMEKGESAVLEYMVMCTQMYYYERFDFAIPYKCLKTIAGLLQTTEEHIKSTVAYCIGNGFFVQEEDELGEKRIYSERRRTELHNMLIAKRTMSEAGKRGNQKRWNKEDNE